LLLTLRRVTSFICTAKYFYRKFAHCFQCNVKSVMIKRSPPFISLIFIFILLCKGIVTLAPEFSPGLKQLLSLELFAEGEPGEQKKGGAKSAESSLTEELFHQIDFHGNELYMPTISRKNIADHNARLPEVCMDVLSPPPNLLA